MIIAISCILIGLISGFVMGFWFRHQFDSLKLRDDSILKRKEKLEAESKAEQKPDIPVRSDRSTNFLRRINSGMKNV